MRWTMPEISVDIEIFCSCGNGLCNQTTGGRNRHGRPGFTVEPCEKCLAKHYDEGYEKGYDKALGEATDEK